MNPPAPNSSSSLWHSASGSSCGPVDHFSEWSVDDTAVFTALRFFPYPTELDTSTSLLPFPPPNTSESATLELCDPLSPSRHLPSLPSTEDKLDALLKYYRARLEAPPPRAPRPQLLDMFRRKDEPTTPPRPVNAEPSSTHPAPLDAAQPVPPFEAGVPNFSTTPPLPRGLRTVLITSLPQGAGTEELRAFLLEWVGRVDRIELYGPVAGVVFVEACGEVARCLCECLRQLC